MQGKINLIVIYKNFNRTTQWNSPLQIIFLRKRRREKNERENMARGKRAT